MAWIERHWERATPVSALLYPASLLYRAAIGMRGASAAPVRLPVPVVVAGNVTVGGTGKTPLVLWLVETLRAHGWAPGIVCRGYGGSGPGPQQVRPGSDPAACGDEAVLLARRSGCEVWAGANRAAAATSLLRSRPDCDVVLSDDGLQHLALARDVELCVVDGARGFGNGWLLPAGPLREPLARVSTVDAVVVNGDPDALHPSIAGLPGDTPRFAMKLAGAGFRNLRDPGRTAGPGDFRGKQVHAVAGIGSPQRFFSHLRNLGLEFTAHPFPDHHPFTAADLAFPAADAILMTEKDAVKCRPIAAETHWELPVSAETDPGLADLVLRKLGDKKN